MHHHSHSYNPFTHGILSGLGHSLGWQAGRSIFSFLGPGIGVVLVLGIAIFAYASYRRRG